MAGAQDSSTMPSRPPPDAPKHSTAPARASSDKLKRDRDYAIVITHIDAPPLAETNTDDNVKPLSRKQQCYASCYACCKPCMTKHNQIWDDASLWERFKYGLMCPPHGNLSKCVTLLLMTVLFWGVSWAITGEEALPGGNLFSLFVLIICCVLGGYVVGLVHLPPLLGE